jgi:hypothetical protein
MTKVTGSSVNFDLQAAIRDAVAKLPPVNPDVTRHVRVVEIDAHIGGNMPNGLFVTIEPKAK